MKKSVFVFVSFFIIHAVTNSYAQKSETIIDSIKTELVNSLESSDTLFRQQIFIDQNVNRKQAINEKILHVTTKEEIVNYLTPDFTGAIIVKIKPQEEGNGKSGKMYMSFKNGKPHGKWEINPNPSRAESYVGYYKNTIRDSVWTFISGSGKGDQHFLSGKYVNGKKEGLWAGYSNDANPYYDTIYYKGGKKNGVFIITSYSGGADLSSSADDFLLNRRRAIFRNDTLIVYDGIEYYQNGNKKSQGRYFVDRVYYKEKDDTHVFTPEEKGKKGSWKYWDESGNPMNIETYKD